MKKIKLETELLKRTSGYYTEIGLSELMYLGKLLTKVKDEIGANDFQFINELVNENLGEFLLLMQYINGGGNID